MSETKNPKAGCRDCPLDCHDHWGGKKKSRLGEYARLWSLAPDQPGLAELVAAYQHLCDDIGLEAFETARAIALARRTGAVGESPEDILESLGEVGRGTALGRIIGSGSIAAADYFREQDQLVEEGPKKHSGTSPVDDAFLDTIGLCAPAYPPLMGCPEALEAMAAMLKARYGRDFTVGELNSLGLWVVKLEESWNRCSAEKADQ